jgi:putative ABC transport system ATP-binding protein
VSLGAPALDAHDLYRFFHTEDEETFALRGVTLTVHDAEIVAVVGRSGSGKSTLLSCLAGLDEPDGGSATVAGERITRRSESVRAAVRARSIGFLGQSQNLLHHLTVAQNVRLARRVARRSGARSVDELLRDVGLSERAGAGPGSLSGGEAARAGLAVALANDPPIVLADEPTGEVDRANEELLLELLRRRARAGGAVLLVTHSSRAAAIADRVVHLEDGRLVDAT